MYDLDWDLILKVFSSFSGIVALLGLMYQMTKDLLSQRPKYKLEVESFEEFDIIFEEIFQTITVRNIGNRPMYIKSFGIVLNDKEYKGKGVKELKKEVKRGKIKPDIESIDDYSQKFSELINAVDKAGKMVEPSSMTAFTYEFDLSIIVDDPLFITVKDVEDNIYVSKNSFDRDIYNSISEKYFYHTN